MLSAWGMLAKDLRYEVSRTHIGDTGSLKAGDVRDVFAEMEQEGRDRLKQAFEGDVSISRSADMRYGEQIYEVDVSLDGVDFDEDDLMKNISDHFHKRHEELFTYSLPDQDAVLVNGRLAAIGALPDLPREPKTENRVETGYCTTRKIYLAGWCDAPVFNLEELVPGQTIEGPAIIESSTTTVVLRADDNVEVTDNLWLNILVGKN